MFTFKRGLFITLFMTFIVIVSAAAILYQPWVMPLPVNKQHADPQRLEKDVRYFSETLYPRSADRREHLDAAAKYITQVFEQHGAQVSEQSVPITGGPFRNIIARYGPQQGPVMIIGAHYDAVAGGDGEAMHYTPGADDNASGVAGLLELARLLQHAPLKTGVELVAYASEEPPFFRSDEMGSAVHANTVQRPVKLMVALEMIGYYDSQPGSQRYPFSALSVLYPDRGDFIAVIGRLNDISAVRQVKAALLGAEGLPVYSINAPEWVPGIDFSDHMNYWRQGISAVMVTDTAFYRNTEYHQPGDTADRLDYEKMAKVVDGVFILLMHDKNE